MTVINAPFTGLLRSLFDNLNSGLTMLIVRSPLCKPLYKPLCKARQSLDLRLLKPVLLAGGSLQLG